jgi:hypothetical protein
VPIRLFGLYLFNTMPALDKVLAGGEMEAFVGDATSDPRAIDLILRSPELLEQACMSADGSLLAFTADGGVQCEENVVPAWQAEQRQHVQDGVVSFQQAWAANRRETSGNLPSLTLAAPQLRRILGRFIGYPTAKEALVFGRWRHEQNFGSTALEPLVPAATLPVLRHMTPEQLVEMPFTILYWIGGAAALCGDAMAQATFSLMTGASMPGTFSIAPPVGKTKVYFDRGGGYDEAHSIELDITTNPLGLSYLQWSGRAAGARRIRIDPADVQAIIRIDVLSLRVVDERRAETFGYRWTSADSLDELIVVGMRPIRDGFFYLDTIDAQMHIDIPVDLSADHEVTVELACQFLLAPSHLLEPTAHVLDVRP